MAMNKTKTQSKTNSLENSDCLQSLYPFLHNKKTDADSLHESLLDSIERKAANHLQVIHDYFENNAEAVVACAQGIANVYKAKGKIFTMGNGGSSSDASHIAVEFLHPVTTGRPALPAFDLSSDKTLMSAIANDVGFEHVYSRQVANLVNKNDALIGVSTSGNSENLLKAFNQAKIKGALCIALTGSGGGEMARSGLQHCLVVESDSIHRIQECHVTIYHILWDLVHTLLADERGYLNKTNTSNQRP